FLGWAARPESRRRSIRRSSRSSRRARPTRVTTRIVSVNRPLRRPLGRRIARVLRGIPAALLLGPLELAIRAALFRKNHTAGGAAFLWATGLALFLWAGLRAVGLSQGRSIAFAVVAGSLIGLFVYLRGEALESPPAGRPGAFLERARARRAQRQ